MKIVVLDKQNFLSDFPEMPFECSWKEYEDTNPEELIERLKDAEVVLTHKVALNEHHFALLPKLKMISTNSTGYNTIDVSAASRYGIVVCNIQNWCTNSVSEHILSFIFSLRRNLIPYHNAVRNGAWEKQAKGSYLIMYPPNKEIFGSTIGIVGYGTLGRHLETKAMALGMNVLLAERKGSEQTRPGYTPFSSVLKESDIIVLLAPLNEQTYKMISAFEINQMKGEALLINCGRGGLVDEHDLANALQNGIIAGAACDVLENEPPEASDPLLSYTGENLILSSHIAFVSRDSISRNTEQIVDNILSYYSGRPKNVVNGIEAAP
ncbi:NAD(P)-dependent oxidoreductase [Pedobacter sp. N23S346]|uniref:NAD(P)-dependent oxidoreductase n=1 Tax=Pedobacter sp. N23S346 TaxID=3402750 RepID=UPI003AD76F7A